MKGLFLNNCDPTSMMDMVLEPQVAIHTCSLPSGKSTMLERVSNLNNLIHLRIVASYHVHLKRYVDHKPFPVLFSPRLIGYIQQFPIDDMSCAVQQPSETSSTYPNRMPASSTQGYVEFFSPIKDLEELMFWGF